MRLTIFEGSDGSGKTTAAQDYAKYTGARYVHLGPFPRVTTGLARLYVEAMLPALLGYQDVVLDRCWMSEPIYGQAFRGGVTRLSPASTRMLERIAMRCETLLVLCQTDLNSTLATFRGRRGVEMLGRESQLFDVWKQYDQEFSRPDRLALPTKFYDYKIHGSFVSYYFGEELGRNIRTAIHAPKWSSGGNLMARYVLVGESFGLHKNVDPLFQVPFVSFTGSGCSQWLTTALANADVSESQLLWVNSDEPELGEILSPDLRTKIFGLGEKASTKLNELGYDFKSVMHPQAMKRFHLNKGYDLITQLREAA